MRIYLVKIDIYIRRFYISDKDIFTLHISDKDIQLMHVSEQVNKKTIHIVYVQYTKYTLGLYRLYKNVNHLKKIKIKH